MHPSRFKEELKRFDKQLDFEFNGRLNRWEVTGTDRKNKKYLIKAVPLGELDKVGLHILQELYDCSPIKQGGSKNLNRRLDALKEEEEKAQEMLERNAIEERHEDAYSHFMYKEGLRVSFANAEPEVKDNSFMVTDRRRVSV